jgi:hypothetical protein
MQLAPYTPGGFERYGLRSDASKTGATTSLSSIAAPAEGAAAVANPWSPANPLFWFGALAALTFGLAAVSTTVRVGGAKASVSLGK